MAEAGQPLAGGEPAADRLSRAQFRTGGRLARSQAEHESILEAIAGGDAAAASAAMRRHIESVYDAYGDYVVGT